MVTVTVRVSADPDTGFRYDCCKNECRAENLSCTIAEVDKMNVVCDCIDMEQSCLRLACPYVVCLRKDKPPVGGKLIWDDYT